MSELIPNLKFTNKLKFIAVGGVILLIILFKSIVVVPAGNIGVKALFGNVYKDPLSSGIHVVNPLITIHEMSVRTQQITEKANVPSKEGLTVQLDLSVLVGLDPKDAPEVYKTIGLNYVDIIVTPQLRSVVRGVTAGYEAKALYTSEREALANQMYEQLKPMVEKRGVKLESVLLRSVKLPEILSVAIEKKLEAEQQQEQKKFVLGKELQEAERKKIEAKGISDYNSEVGRVLTDNVLKLRAIEATKELAKSENAKIIMIGNKDGLPVILGGQ